MNHDSDNENPKPSSGELLSESVLVFATSPLFRWGCAGVYAS